MTEPESSHTSQSSSSPEASPTSSKSPTQNGITISTEGHVNQLQETLITERDALTVNLKSARRESQKADAALRVEIETFQRSSEKLRSFRATCKAKDPCSSGSAKRAIAAAQETEEKMREVEALLPDLVKKKEKERRECEKLEAEAAKVRKEREQIEEAEKK